LSKGEQKGRGGEAAEVIMKGKLVKIPIPSSGIKKGFFFQSFRRRGEGFFRRW